MIGGGTRVRYDRDAGYTTRMGLSGTVVGLHADRDVIEWFPWVLQVLVEWDDGVVMRHMARYLYVTEDK